MTTSSSHNPNQSGDTFLAWLNKATPNDLGLQAVNDDQIIETFRSEKYNLLSPPPNDFAKVTSPNDSAIAPNVSVSKANRIYRCQIAQMSADWNFLSLPHYRIQKTKEYICTSGE
jgi:hypothetical protein